ncbi:hypothetical protein IFM89_029699 [Coptis chinensis]|uniref:RRM domain-containing protein n=1 Tax=Coptis chinensis TaxID=261450 RepID=A0A835ICK4_9MAGN|nr:hypothetical protein IFM89_029699 [Coptis chinensis]
MPPRTPLKKRKIITPNSTTTPPPPPPLVNNNTTETSPKSDPSQSDNRPTTFDLNEPWCDANEGEKKKEEGGDEGDVEKVKEVVEHRNEKRKIEDEEEEEEEEEEGIPRERRNRKSMKCLWKNKGFAFVRFATVEQAKRAAAELNYTQVRGKVCEVTRNNDNETLHLGNVCTTWTKDTLVEKLQPYELENLEDVHVIEDPKDRKRNRGYAFLNFSTHMDAVAACNKLQKGSLYLGTTVRADVAFAKSAVEPDEQIMSQVKSVFLDGLPASWDESQVQKQFQKYGEIEHVQLARNMPSAKRKDFGFVYFRTREAALTCIDAVNKDGIGDVRKVFLRATLKRPLQRRVPSAVGGWRGYDTDDYNGWSTRPSGIGRSYSNRENREVESFGRGHSPDHRIPGYNRYSTRGAVLETATSPVDIYGGRSRYSNRTSFETRYTPVEEYSSQFRRGSVRQAPSKLKSFQFNTLDSLYILACAKTSILNFSASATSHSRPRAPYFESSSSSRQSSRNYEDFPVTYSRSHVPSRGEYDDDSYDIRYDYYENNSVDTYDYPTPSRLKRPYSAVDDDRIVSRPLTRRSRSGGVDRDMGSYPVRVFSSFEEYSRSTQDVHHGYDSVGHERRYSSGRGAPRSYEN